MRSSARKEISAQGYFSLMAETAGRVSIASPMRSGLRARIFLNGIFTNDLLQFIFEGFYRKLLFNPHSSCPAGSFGKRRGAGRSQNGVGKRNVISRGYKNSVFTLLD